MILVMAWLTLLESTNIHPLAVRKSTLRTDILTKAALHAGSDDFFQDLTRLISYPTESSTESGRLALSAYLGEVLTPALEALGAAVARYDNWRGSGNSFLIGTRWEGESLPTLLLYGHADVVPGQSGQWADARDPWVLEADGDYWYGRGIADNKGQHWINLTALRLVLEERGHLGFNLKYLFECGEEIGSPSLDEFAEAHAEELAADVFLASDGPRLAADTPTLFLGNRGGIGFELAVDLRTGDYHSGNWGGLLRNPATTLAAAIGSLVDGHGRIQLSELLPAEGIPRSVRDALADVKIHTEEHDPHVDEDWADTSLTAAERVYGWNTLEVLAMSAGNTADPVNAIPGEARAVLQLRYVVGTDVDDIESTLRSHLDRCGFTMVSVRTLARYEASRTDPTNPWVGWASDSIQRTTGTTPAILPNFGGSLPNSVFESTLGLPTIWVPHSYPGCLQHSPNEHMLARVAREGLRIAAGLFFDLGAPRDSGVPSLRDLVESA